jgi:DNA-binding transcriptional regulator LsrR (DeoR family)
MVATRTHASDTDGYRLLARVARMYHERGMRQPQIAADLRISQSSVSRLLQQASDAGIVRTVVSMPSGVYTHLEEELESRYGLLDSVVVDTERSSADRIRALGASAASYLRETLDNGDIVGLPAWSPILVATVEAMRPKIGLAVKVVAQISGGSGNPRSQIETTRLIDRFAHVTGARPVLLPPPGCGGSLAAQRALLGDPVVRRVQQSWKQLSVALVDIASVQPEVAQYHGHALKEQGRVVEAPELRAVGQICLRYFDSHGDLVKSPLNERALGIQVDELKAVPRRIGIASGCGIETAVAAAVSGGWVNTLITDLGTAQRLLDA